jgi:hypothetical protein
MITRFWFLIADHNGYGLTLAFIIPLVSFRSCCFVRQQETHDLVTCFNVHKPCRPMLLYAAEHISHGCLTCSINRCSALIF